ncbi:hypothetical protein CYLTODRAFT_418037 [Cylindrobasidium torrendii FP15055 ss-10]|uniref:Uncharacterized protein n=1 Tax=Cylindrobasidium torrendii FP15055 ss-10 TaxID=1314674 RepID=A0A0D7BPX5_9AGAR|nr:hypothetical protein CYLTODRAFT_418037 [Cylindrobasidium torrendii FP15055 ss-10]
MATPPPDLVLAQSTVAAKSVILLLPTSATLVAGRATAALGLQSLRALDTWSEAALRLNTRSEMGLLFNPPN